MRGPVEHQPALDGLRGVAVAMVVLTHTTVLAPHMPLAWLAEHGYLGVDVFFVLSGFLITALLLAEHAGGAVSLRGFYARRARRLLPALYCLLGVFSMYVIVTGLPFAPMRDYLWSSLLYVQNYVIPHFPHGVKTFGLGHLWSLSIEEQFYLVWPAVLVVLARRRWVAPTVLVAGAVVVGWHRAHAWSPAFHVLLVAPAHTENRADGLLIGCLAAFAWQRGWFAARLRVGVAWCAVPVAMLIVWYGAITERWMWQWGWTLFDVACACVMLGAVSGWGRVLRSSSLRLLGRVSYGLYLWHLPIFYAVLRFTAGWDALPRVLLAYAFAVSATALSLRYVERPFRTRQRIAAMTQ